jgi:glycosyltransferase involved in cell wall biosynthesis
MQPTSQPVFPPPHFTPDLSVVVPIYNEVENLEPFHQSLLEALRSLDRSWEITYVDDGSTDGSQALLTRLANQRDDIRVVCFRRNFGQTAALAAGFACTSGETIVTLDGDCQNDPHDIPKLLSKIDEGYDVVSGWRVKRRDAQLLRKIPSRVANGLISKVTGVPLHDYGCTLKAYKREVIDGIRLYGEMHRFIPAYAAMVGAKIAEIPVNHYPRTRGKSKYGISRIYRVALDLLTVKFLSTYATKPLYLFGRFALALLALAFMCFAAMVVLRITAGFFFVNSPLLLLTAVLFILASQTVLFGLLGEITMRTYHESQQKPTYTVRNVVGLQWSQRKPTDAGQFYGGARRHEMPVEMPIEMPSIVSG